jgi:hypothetical protein
VDPEIVELDEQNSVESPHLQLHSQSAPTAPQLSRKADRSRSDHSTTAEAEVSHLIPDDIQEQLDAQWQDIDRIMDLAGNLRKDVDQMKGLLSDLTAQVRASRHDPAASGSGEKIERLTLELTTVGAKASEVDVLRTELQAMKNRMRRFEAMQGPSSSMMASTSSTLTKPPRDGGATRGGSLNIPADRGHDIGSQSQEPARDAQRPRPKNAIKPSRDGPVPKTVQSMQESSPSTHTATAARPSHGRAESYASHNRPSPEILIASNPLSTNATSNKRKRQPPSHLSNYVDWSSVENAELESPPTEETEGPKKKLTKKYYDAHRKEISFAIGDEVLINAKNLRVRKPCKKLTDRYVGPFRVSKSVGPNAYELELPETYGRLHRTFPVSLLEPYSRREGEEPPGPVDLDEEDRFQVESIRKERGSKENPQFLVKWQGYPEHDNTWEPLDHLDDCDDLIEEFRMRNERVKHAKHADES